MRLLIVAMVDSIHTVRWISQFKDEGWDIRVFPSTDLGIIHPKLQGVTVYHSFYSRKAKNCDVRYRGIPVVSDSLAYVFRKICERLLPSYRKLYLSFIIRTFNPDIVHSMETQAAGYLTLATKMMHRQPFPRWMHTIWGSDIYLFGKLTAHKEKVEHVLKNCDYLVCEGERDRSLAADFGFCKSHIVLQATGGFDLTACAALRNPLAPSSRRRIMLKGYQSWAGRALVGLRALERTTDLLGGYEIIIYSASADVAVSAELFSAKTGIPVVLLPKVSHDEIMTLHGDSRISISLSISDGVPNSLLEAMAMGSFPIQSFTACIDEWVEDGENAILVPPEDPEVVERAIRKALTDDLMVDKAAKINWQLTVERLDSEQLRHKALESYMHLLRQERKYEKEQHRY